MYKENLNKQIIGEISFQFNPPAGQLKLSDLKKSFANGQFEKRVPHFGIGKTTCRLKSSRDIFIPFIGSSLSYCLNVVGKSANEQRKSVLSPETDRRLKKNGIINVLMDELEDIDMDIKYCLYREKDIIDFPSWDDQIRGIEFRVEKMSLVEYDDVVKDILNEIYDLWPKWNLRARGIIVKRRLRNFKNIVIEKCIAFDKYPIWRKDFSFYQIKCIIECKTRLHYFINYDFFEHVRKNLIFDWENFFENCNAIGGRSLEDLVEEVDNFIMKATRITRFHWPLSICKTLLKYSQEWINWMGKDSEEYIIKFFNGIASLQRHLLIEAINENFQSFLKYRSSDNTKNNNVNIDCECLDDSDNELILYNVVKQISILGDEIPRCETKLFPEMFKEKKFINCGNDVNLPLFRIRFHNIFILFEKEYIELRKKVDVFLTENLKPDEWKKLCIYCLEYQQRLQVKGSTTFSESIMVNYIAKKTKLQDNTSDMIGELRRHMDDYLSLQMKDIVDFYGVSSSKLYGKSEIDQICSIAQVKEKDLPRLKEKLENVKKAFKVVLDLDMANETIFLKLFNILHLPKNLTLLIELIQSILKVDQEDIEKEITIQAKEMYEEVSALDREVHFARRKYVNIRYHQEIGRVAKRFEDAEKRLKVIIEEFPILQKRMEVLDLDPLNIDIEKLLNRTSVFKTFANVNYKISQFYEKTMHQLVVQINYNQFDECLIEMNKYLDYLKHEKKKYNDIVLTNVIDIVYGRMERMINECNKAMPILKMLCSEGMKDRHFVKIFHSTDNTYITKENLTVKKLLELNLSEQVDVCEEVTEIANKELRLEETLKQMQQQWEELEDAGLSSVLFDGATQSLLNEHIIKTQTIISSPFAEAIMDQLNKWLKTLFETSDILKLFNVCHLKWQAMEPIFVSEDIVYQLPDEWRLFQNVDNKWHLISSKVMNCKQAVKITESNIMEDLNKMLEDINSIQSGFERYLQIRKINYPRLFFLANTELLELLAKYRNTKSICNFLPKIFSSICDLTFNTRGDIIEIINENDEKLILSRPIHASLSKSHLEKRLNELEKEMIWSLKNILKKLIKNNGINFDNPEHILAENLDQICLLYYRLATTMCIESGINGSNVDFSIKTLLNFRSCCQKLLKINDDNWIKKRLLLQSLVVEIDEYVSICKQLINSEVYLVDHLLWKRELRYYWKNDNLFIRMLHLNIIYSYEFLSITQLITPTVQTKKLWRHLLYAQTQHYGGIICGPPATGKSESCKTLAALLGRHSFSFNCSEQVSRNQIEDLIIGAVLSGTCLCLDEFNRLQTNTMAWFANHIVGIYQSISSGNMKYEIMDNEIVLKSNFLIAVTLNPDKIGRYPIPENVTPAFKVILASTPGLLTICESYMKMNEFKNYQILSKSIVKILSTLEYLLTPMKHYSFKLRTIFSIITESVRNKDNNIHEFDAVKLAMVFILKPFLIERDNLVFDTVLNYTFHGKIQNRNNDGKVYDEEEMNKIFSIITKKFPFKINTKCRHKCFEILKISRISKAILILGRSLTAKSTLLSLASEILSQVEGKKITVKIFNPSRFSQESIFGSFRQKFNDWHNGFLVQMLRSNLNDNEELWIVFDGLLDSEWAESLNSLLDSNNKLNLANGESVFLKSNIKIFFETDSVERIVASTISRCRVINTNDIDVDISSSLVSDEYELIFKVVNLLKFPNSSIRNYFYVQFLNILNVYKTFWTSSSSNTLMFEIQYIFQNLIIPRQEFLKNFDLEKFRLPHPVRSDKTSTSIFDSTYLEQFNSILSKLIYGNQLLILVGTFGSGKTTFLEKFASSLDVSLWEVYKFDMTTETTATIFLDSLLQTKLFRITKSHYTVPGNRNILIIINSLHLICDIPRNSIWEFLRCYYDRKIIQHIDGTECTFENVYFLAEYSTKYTNDIIEKIPQRIRRYVLPFSFQDFPRWKRPESTLCLFVNQLSSIVTNNPIIFYEIRYFYKYLSERQKTVYRMLDDFFKECDEKDSDFVIFNNENKQKTEILLHSFKEFLLKKRKDFTNIFHIIEIPIIDLTSRRIAFLWKTFFVSNYHSIIFTSFNSWDMEIASFACYLEKINFEVIYPDISSIHWNIILTKAVNTAVVEDKKVLLYIPDNIYDKTTMKIILKDVTQLINNGLPLDLFGPKSINELADSFYMRSSIKPISEILKNQETSSESKQLKATTNEWKKYQCVQKLLKANLKIRFAITDDTHGIGKLREFQDYCVIEDWRKWTENDFLDIGISILEESGEFSDGQSSNFVHRMINIHNIIQKVDHSISIKSFIDFCKTYCYLCKKMRIGIETLDKRYKAGIKRIVKADEQMNFLQQELLRLQPELLRTSLETSQLICIIEKETIEVENTREVVASNEFKANTAATNAQSLRAECENDLAEAIPALESAIDALQCIDQKDISMLKAMRFPPSGVRLCMEAICILLEEQPTKIHEPGKKVIFDYWITAQKLLSDMHFLQRIKNFDKDKVPSKVIRKIRREYLSREDLDPENIKASSVAAEGLCKWIRGIDTYLKISEFIEPKKQKLRESEILVKTEMKLLESKRKALMEITERLQKLSDQFSQMSQRKEDLIENINNCEIKMGRAERLLNALMVEKVKWKDKLIELKQKSEAYKYNMLVGAAVMEYISNWEHIKKQQMINEITSLSGSKELFKMSMFFDPTSQYLSYQKDLINTFSIVLSSRKVPLVFDTQGAVPRNISYMVGEGLVTVDCHDKNLPDVLKNCIIEGKVLLIDNIVNPIPLVIFQVCNKQLFIVKETKMLRYNNEMIPYNDNFHVILCSSHKINQFSSEFISYLCCISITVNEEIIKNNLSEELLKVIASNQMSRKTNLDENNLELSNKLKDIEENILMLLAKSKDLENEASIDMLNEMKIITLKIQENKKEINLINEHLTQITNSYMSVINHAIKIIKISMNLPILNGLYSRSLNYLIDVFKDALINITSDIKETNNDQLRDDISKYFIEVLGMALFKPHQQIFEFVVLNLVNFDFFSSSHELNLDKLFNEYEKFLRLTSKQNNELFENLKKIYTLNKPVLFAYSSSISSDYLLQSLHQLSMTVNINQKCSIISIDEIDKIKWNKYFEDGRWIIIENCHLGIPENISQLILILKNLSNKEITNRSDYFRLFVTISSDGMKEDCALFDNITVVAMDRVFTIRSFLKFCYTNKVICDIHDNTETLIFRQTLFKLCIFHYVLIERSKYGIYGWFNEFLPTFTDFISMINLYKENMTVIKHEYFESIYQNILELSYQGKMSDENDLLTFIMLAKWIFVGFNKFDNIIIEGLLNFDLSSSSEMIALKIDNFNFCQSLHLSGLNKRVSEIFLEQEVITHRDFLLKMIKKSTKALKMTDMFKRGFQKSDIIEQNDLAFILEKVPSSYTLKNLTHLDHVGFCITNEINFLKTKLKDSSKLFLQIQYLETILLTKGIRKIDLRRILKPISIIEAVKLDYAKKYDCSIEEVYCFGTLKEPEDKSHVLELQGCYLIGCTYDKKTQKNIYILKELSPTDRPSTPIPSIYVCLKNVSSDFFCALSKNFIISELISSKKQQENQPKTLKEMYFQLYHFDSTLNEYVPVLPIMIPSNIPESHWCLRGIKLLTSSPKIY